VAASAAADFCGGLRGSDRRYLTGLFWGQAETRAGPGKWNRAGSLAKSARLTAKDPALLGQRVVSPKAAQRTLLLRIREIGDAHDTIATEKVAVCWNGGRLSAVQNTRFRWR